MSASRLLALTSALLFLALPSHAASRARYGGTLQVAYAGKPAEADPAFADAPAEAALLGLVSRPLCASPFVLTRVGPLWVRLEVPPPLKATEVTAALKRAREEASPYRALLAPIAQLSTSGAAVELKLQYPWPDLETALCHPALALAAFGPFKLKAPAGHYAADPAFPAGRPYVDEVVVTSTDDRGVERLFAQKKAQLALGLTTPGADKAPMPYATSLLFAPSLPPTFRAAFESAVDRADLVRFFVKAPAAPALAPAAQPRPAALAPPREVTLLYDASLDDQRAVAARLQVRLSPLGYRVALKALPRRELRARWSKGDYQLMLFSVLLPPRPANALAVVLESARAAELSAKQLPALGALGDEAARDDRARELLGTLLPQLNALPLYVQGLAWSQGGTVQALKLDAYGLPRLDDVFLGAE
ncbi:MAG: peptide ABC transporter substrate-binding protein [Archangiaceae bacterium]|nr:peptide ABC transporter substrate-binding protein [Archangiaceae bacterium]